MLKAGLIGCGNISGAYLRNKDVFRHLRVVKCASRRIESARSTAEQFGLQAVTVDELLRDPEIDLILNLTTPDAHAEINLRALEAGKHVYTEKPFAVTREDARKVLRLASEKGLRTGCAPDTFLGGGHQLCRKLIDSGAVGKISGGCAIMANRGPEGWHPNSGFYYLKGGGPLMDMGPYYITALVNLLGPVKRVAGFGGRAVDLRLGRDANLGKTYPVEVDTHFAAVLEFASGAAINLTMSFDVFRLSGQMENCIELWGLDGALRTPDPNTFNGEVRFANAGTKDGWETPENTFIYNDNMRLIGLADMAAGIELGRPHRCSGELAYHVTDVMWSILESAETRQTVAPESTCARPAPLREGLAPGELD
jgi:predicted dehydrogenase